MVKYATAGGKAESYWKKKLTKKQYEVLRKGATEPPFSGKYVKEKSDGVYVCAACEAELFDSKKKFDSGCGWPSFFDSLGTVELRMDNSHGKHQTEVVCKRCKSHLGHVFDDGPAPTGKRYCINSVSLDLRKCK